MNLFCACGCGAALASSKAKYTTGHSAKGRPQSAEHVAKRIAAMQATIAAQKAQFGDTRVCSKCHERKPLSEFGLRDNRRWFRSQCKPCERRKSLEWSRANPERAAANNRKACWRARYGITEAEYCAMLAAQDGKCLICGATKPDDTRKYMYVDHNHRTGKIRGLLCGKCNTGIGVFHESIYRMERAIAYLRNNLEEFDKTHQAPEE